MKTRGSSLVQALLVLGLFAAVVVGLLNLNLTEPSSVVTSKEHRRAKTSQKVRAALVVACDRYLQGVTLYKSPATLLTRVNFDFPEEPTLQVLAAFPPSTLLNDFHANQSYQIVLSTRVEDSDPVLSRMSVSGSPGEVGGTPTLTVEECTANPYDRECKRQVELSAKSTDTFEQIGLSSFRTFGKCLKKSFKDYGLQTCIEPYITTAQTYNLCAEFAEQALTKGEDFKTSSLNTMCAYQFSQTLNRIPSSWAHNLATCILGGNNNCPESICDMR